MPDSVRPPIRIGEVYRLEDFQTLTGLGRYAIRSARRGGLTVRYAHGSAFVMGDDWIAYLLGQTNQAARAK